MTSPSSTTSQNAPFFVDRETITLTRNGIWLSDGIEIDHEGTVRMFFRSLKHDAEGWYLQVKHETKRIGVEDTAYFVKSLEGTAQRGFELLLSDESRERLDPLTLSYRPGRLACRVRGKAEEAKFLSAAYFELLRGLEEDAGSYFLTIEGKRIELARK